LLTIGALAVCAEFLRPGTIIPGVLGCISLLFGFAALPHIRWQGALLSIVALALLALEAKYPSRHLLTAAGTVTLPLGALIMEPRIHLITAVLTTVPLAIVVSFLYNAAVRAHRNKSL
jgi:membrane-bound serine protease (ClpP class)